MTCVVHHGDCLEMIPTLGVTVDAVVTDPPYHLLQISRGGSPRQNDPEKPFGRAEARGGFMGQQWDGGDIAFRPETWATIGSALRPGGFLVAFGGTRTYHRLTCAIEDAGFVIQDCLMWLFATGFPKRRDMLKPAYEPIVLAYKPGGKRTMQVDECRIAATDNTTKEWRGAGDRSREEYRTGTSGRPIPTDLGRWPANICHDGSDEVVAAFPETTVTGFRSAESKGRWQDPQSRMPGQGGTNRKGVEYPGDSTNASRFFFSAKAGAQDRWGSRHPTVKPVELLTWLVAMVTPLGGTVLDPFAGSGTTAVAVLATGRNAILIEREDNWFADIRERLAFYEGGGRHSIAAKNRSRKTAAGPLFEGFQP